jgi:Ca2+-binding EF-hand superfamily protein
VRDARAILKTYAAQVAKYLLSGTDVPMPAATVVAPQEAESEDDYDKTFVMNLFKEFDTDGNGTIDYAEFSHALKRINVVPKKLPFEK